MSSPRAADEPAFVVTLDRATAEGQFPDRDGKRLVSGRLYVFLSQREVREPMRGPSWFQPEPFFAVDVRNVAPGGVCRVDRTADGYPESLDKLPAGKYRARRFWTTISIIRTSRAASATFIARRARSRSILRHRKHFRSLEKVIAAEPLPDTAWMHEIAQGAASFYRRSSAMTSSNDARSCCQPVTTTNRNGVTRWFTRFRGLADRTGRRTTAKRRTGRRGRDRLYSRLSQR